MNGNKTHSATVRECNGSNKEREFLPARQYRDIIAVLHTPSYLLHLTCVAFPTSVVRGKETSSSPIHEKVRVVCCRYTCYGSTQRAQTLGDPLPPLDTDACMKNIRSLAGRCYFGSQPSTTRAVVDHTLAALTSCEDVVGIIKRR